MNLISKLFLKIQIFYKVQKFTFQFPNINYHKVIIFAYIIFKGIVQYNPF